jgi:hypothetical protein
MSHARVGAGSDRCLNLAHAIIVDESTGMRGNDQTFRDFTAIQLAASDELKKAKCCAIELMIARTRMRMRDHIGFAIERGLSIMIMVADTDIGSYEIKISLRSALRQFDQPIRRRR